MKRLPSPACNVLATARDDDGVPIAPAIVYGPVSGELPDSVGYCSLVVTESHSYEVRQGEGYGEEPVLVCTLISTTAEFESGPVSVSEHENPAAPGLTRPKLWKIDGLGDMEPQITTGHFSSGDHEWDVETERVTYRSPPPNNRLPDDNRWSVRAKFEAGYEGVVICDVHAGGLHAKSQYCIHEFGDGSDGPLDWFRRIRYASSGPSNPFGNGSVGWTDAFPDTFEQAEFDGRVPSSTVDGFKWTRDGGGGEQWWFPPVESPDEEPEEKHGGTWARFTRTYELYSATRTKRVWHSTDSADKWEEHCEGRMYDGDWDTLYGTYSGDEDAAVRGESDWLVYRSSSKVVAGEELCWGSSFAAETEVWEWQVVEPDPIPEGYDPSPPCGSPWWAHDHGGQPPPILSNEWGYYLYTTAPPPQQPVYAYDEVEMPPPIVASVGEYGDILYRDDFYYAKVLRWHPADGFTISSETVESTPVASVVADPDGETLRNYASDPLGNKRFYLPMETGDGYFVDAWDFDTVTDQSAGYNWTGLVLVDLE